MDGGPTNVSCRCGFVRFHCISPPAHRQSVGLPGNWHAYDGNGEIQVTNLRSHISTQRRACMYANAHTTG